LKIKAPVNSDAMQKAIFLSVMFSLCFRLEGNAQTTEKDSTAETGSSIEVSVDYAGDSGFFGIYNNLVAQPMLGSTISYYGKKGLYLLANGYSVGNSDPTLSKSTGEIDLIGGWNFYLFNDALTLSPNYGHFYYTSGSTTAKSMYTDEIGLAINGTLNWFRPSLTTDYLFGTQKSLNINLTTAFHLEKENLLAEGNTLEFDPSAGTNYGNNSFYFRLANLNLNSLKSLRAQYGDNITIKQLLVLNAITRNKQIDRQLAHLSENTTLGQIFNFTPTNQINSIDLLFPVKYNIQNLTLSTACIISFPMNIPDFISSKTRVYLSAGILYSFDL
jgi:hypothetical protein